MALHWSKQFISLLKSLQTILATNGLLAFSIPLNETFKELSQHYSLNQFYDLKTLGLLLPQYNYKILCAHEEKKILYFPNTKSALQSIQKIGASYVSSRKHRGLRGRNFSTQANITQLTYHIGYFLLNRDPGT
jgi:hypothetical protein